MLITIPDEHIHVNTNLKAKTHKKALKIAINTMV